MIFLHGANSGGAELKPLVDAMAPFTPVRTPDWQGHAGRPIPARITIRSLADDLVAWMDREGIEREVVGGYSLGGTVALVAARHYPQRVSGVVALATKHRFDAPTIERWKYLASHERVARVRYSWGTRVDELTKLHAPNGWKDVLDANVRLFDTLLAEPPLPAEDLRAIEAPVIVVSSNFDPLVPWDETLALGRALRRPHVAMFHGAAHPLRSIPLMAIARTIDQWMRDNALKA
jgi:pimeloyl-ACP methyl ester carboxylesterase